jgi:hypothetical protein
MSLKTDCYILLANKDEASGLIKEIDKILSEHWAEPIVHPFSGKTLVPWNDDYLKNAVHLIHGKKVVARAQAAEQGWNLGYHQGPFAKASTKLEDADFAREAINGFDAYPNYPAYRAAFYGVLASLYGVKEALRKTAIAISGEAPKWWKAKFKEIEGDSLLKLFYDLHNSDKHDLQIKHLRPNMKLLSYTGPEPDISSGEGVFSIINRGTKNERRIFHAGAKTVFSCYLDVAGLKHKGSDVSHLSLKEQIDLVVEHYRDLVYEAKNTFPGTHS